MFGHFCGEKNSSFEDGGGGVESRIRTKSEFDKELTHFPICWSNRN